MANCARSDIDRAVSLMMLQKFPNEPLANVVRNVFDFDRYSQEVFETLVTVLHKHGIPVGTSPTNIALAKE